MLVYCYCSVVLKKHNVIVLSDEIYARIHFADQHDTVARVRVLHCSLISRTHTHTRTHARTHTHIYINYTYNICVIYIYIVYKIILYICVCIHVYIYNICL